MEKDIYLSIVIPIYNEEESIIEFYQGLTLAMNQNNWEYEIVFVDDGSTDRSFKILKDLHTKDRRIKIIKLTKNFGQTIGLLAGFEYSRGKIIITIDADLQNDPSDISNFIAKVEEGFEIVSGWRHKRKDSLIRRLVSFVASLLMWGKTGIRLHDYGCAPCAVKRELANRLKDYGKHARFIKPLLVSLANSVAEVKVRHYARKRGDSKYGLFKIIKFGLDFMINFPARPQKSYRLHFNIEEIIEQR
jgi:glycosyltransferase involved in cell wall biosynthesis